MCWKVLNLLSVGVDYVGSSVVMWIMPYVT